jgi:hypothetical protein
MSSYIYRSLMKGGWMVVNASGHEFGPYRWQWQAKFFHWCLREAGEK